LATTDQSHNRGQVPCDGLKTSEAIRVWPLLGTRRKVCRRATSPRTSTLADSTDVRIDTNKMAFIPDRERAGVEIMPLFLDDREDVRLERWAPGATVALDASGGMEVLVLAGWFSERDEAFLLQSWSRLPNDGVAWATVGVNGARVWIKRGHLAEMPRPPA
jgi:hypothetical protein